MRFSYLLIICCLILSVSCVSTSKYTESLHTVQRLQTDSALLEKRVHMLQDEVHFLSTKSATMEQALTQRLQEKEDSLNQKQQLLSDKERSIKDMKARKAEERDAFVKLSSTIIKPFSAFPTTDVITGTNCTQTVVEVSDRILFMPASSKIDAAKVSQLATTISSVLSKQPDLKLIIISHTDSVYAGKEKWDDNWSLGAAKSNALARLLIKEYNIAPQRLLPATHAETIDTPKTANGLGKNRVTLLFYSDLLPCIHTGE